ncbi:Tigger transposable element-derived protein 6-like [Oopsacas minuta]|uniref:Tigger transposable element-derived protein 6-like n=1 Tax=Oopsacas minuta TaxID=111878 RepID=A0AAV7JFA9_9METZ|nr:Tigger transposable element-derived protein 6-like [Oopsacas minuta]
MDTTMFDEWLKDLNRSMAKKKRNILLFLDNAPRNLQIKLSNVVSKFFLANCTSELQPMDQDIIKKLKNGYRKRLLRRVIAKLDSVETGDELI